ncbi:helix-turn-helix transcriptional regulator [Miltoncostaea marina]|uniref:helix-turn-helix transcriptional regulator n=1 Tax=Miltoncostaea marina TaxID=2843215 RepID=UPI001C3C8995|nr:LuxR family transcriptional regulator [Miltoncostaea marina]
MTLLGRDADLAAMRELLASARESRGGGLVIRGEGGVGKTALLRAAEEEAAGAGMRVLRATGVETESELPFASLHQVLAPGLDRLGALPAPQAAALRGAFGLSAERVDDRFLISLGALGLLADLADEGPLLVSVDDAQWLDRPSAEALGFVARRLVAEPIALLFAAREGDARRFDGPGIPDRRVAGLERAAARALLEASAGGAVAPHVAERLVTVTGGNPLALVEMPQLLEPDQLAGRRPLPEHLPLTSRLEQSFAERARGLDEGARAVLAVAAADDTGALGVVAAAAARLGAGAEAIEAAERSGLLGIAGDRVTLRHPIARAALHRGLALGARRAAHLALAEVLSGDDEADRRAWHRAAAAIAPDEAIAAELERTAERAGLRSGHAAAAAALERAARLSADDAARARRLVAAAEAAWQAGRAPLAQGLADEAEALAGDDALRNRVRSVRAAIAMVRGRPADAHALLLEAAAHAPDPAVRADLLLRAGEAAAAAGDAAGLARADERAAGLPAGVAVAGRAWLAGVRRAAEGRIAEALEPLRAASAASEGEDDPRQLVWSSNADAWLGDLDRTLVLQRRAIELARARGALGTVAVALTRRGALLAWHGRVHEAWADGEEALRLTEEAGIENSTAQARAVLAGVAALRGDEDACREHAERALAQAARRGLLATWETTTFALSELALARRRYEEALERLAQMAAGGRRVMTPLAHHAAVPRLVEAAVRAGRPEAAAAPLERFARWAGLTGAPGAAALLLRCRGLVAGGEEGLALLEAAVAEPDPARWSLSRARSELFLGEALRRARRRGEARAALRPALEAFEGLGATAWADRAREELAATGESLRRRDPGAVAALTPQERRIARSVAEGSSNKEVASQLFLSPKTVEYHLGKVFQKLGIGSRADLAALGVDAFA